MEAKSIVDYSQQIFWDIRNLETHSTRTWVKQASNECMGFLISCPLSTTVGRSQLGLIKKMEAQAYCDFKHISPKTTLAHNLAKLKSLGVGYAELSWEEAVELTPEALGNFPLIVVDTPPLRTVGERSAAQPGIARVVSQLSPVNLYGAKVDYDTSGIVRSRAPSMKQFVEVRPNWMWQPGEDNQPLPLPSSALVERYDFLMIKPRYWDDPYRALKLTMQEIWQNLKNSDRKIPVVQ
jgi:hypothetical protein